MNMPTLMQTRKYISDLAGNMMIYPGIAIKVLKDLRIPDEGLMHPHYRFVIDCMASMHLRFEDEVKPNVACPAPDYRLAVPVNGWSAGLAVREITGIWNSYGLEPQTGVLGSDRLPTIAEHAADKYREIRIGRLVAGLRAESDEVLRRLSAAEEKLSSELSLPAGTFSGTDKENLTILALIDHRAKLTDEALYLASGTYLNALLGMSDGKEAKA